MIVLILILLGLCLGSFTNALVWRLHQQARAKKKSSRYSIVKGHSMCPSCKHQLGARDLVPVLSWVELRGRCRYCQAKISWQYPLVELLMAGLFVLSYMQWPHDFSMWGSIAFGFWLVSVVILVALLVYDLRWMILPDRLVYPLTGAAVGLVLALSVKENSPGLVISATAGAGLLFGLFWGLFQISGGKWIGGGDVKLAVALGLLAGGLVESILLLFLASLLGTLVSLPLLAAGRKASHKVPFGPFLIAAAFVVFLWGSSITSWYSGLIGV